MKKNSFDRFWSISNRIFKGGFEEFGLNKIYSVDVYEKGEDIGRTGFGGLKI